MKYCIPYLSNVAISAFEMKKGVKYSFYIIIYNYINIKLYLFYEENTI